jgi:hypothetical protein
MMYEKYELIVLLRHKRQNDPEANKSRLQFTIDVGCPAETTCDWTSYMTAPSKGQRSFPSVTSDDV